MLVTRNERCVAENPQDSWQDGWNNSRSLTLRFVIDHQNADAMSSGFPANSLGVPLMGLTMQSHFLQHSLSGYSKHL